MSQSDAIVAKIKSQNEKELVLLREAIERLGTKQENGNYTVKFGVLVRDERVNKTFEGLNATLTTAKKRGIVTYSAQLLLQGTHDDVVITLVKGDKTTATGDGTAGKTKKPKSTKRVMCGSCETQLAIPITASKFQCPKCEGITQLVVQEARVSTPTNSGSSSSSTTIPATGTGTIGRKNSRARSGSTTSGVRVPLEIKEDEEPLFSSPLSPKDKETTKEPEPEPEPEREETPEEKRAKIARRMAGLSAAGRMGGGMPMVGLFLPSKTEKVDDELPAPRTSTPGRLSTGRKNSEDEPTAKATVVATPVDDMKPTIERLLIELSLEKYISKFQSELIGIDVLLLLEASELQALIPDVNDRQTLLMKVAEIRANNGVYVPKKREKMNITPPRKSSGSAIGTGTPLKSGVGPLFPNLSSPSSAATSSAAAATTPSTTTSTSTPTTTTPRKSSFGGFGGTGSTSNMAPLFPKLKPTHSTVSTTSTTSTTTTATTSATSTSTISTSTISSTTSTTIPITSPSSIPSTHPSQSHSSTSSLKENELRKKIENLEDELKLRKEEHRKEVQLLRAQIKTHSQAESQPNTAALQAEYERGRNEVLDACKQKIDKMKAQAQTKFEQQQSEIDELKADREKVIAKQKQYVQQVREKEKEREEKEKDKEKDKEKEAQGLLKNLYKLFRDEVQEKDYYEGKEVLDLVKKVLQTASKTMTQ